jgi:hypothetical protein
VLVLRRLHSTPAAPFRPPASARGTRRPSRTYWSSFLGRSGSAGMSRTLHESWERSSMASSRAESGRRWVTKLDRSSLPLATSSAICSHVPQSERPKLPVKVSPFLIRYAATSVQSAFLESPQRPPLLPCGGLQGAPVARPVLLKPRKRHQNQSCRPKASCTSRRHHLRG